MSFERFLKIASVTIVVASLPALACVYEKLGMGDYWEQLAVAAFALLLTLFSLASEYGEPGSGLRLTASCAITAGLFLAVLAFRQPGLFPPYTLPFCLTVLVGGGLAAMAWQVLLEQPRRPALMRVLSVLATVMGMSLGPVVGRWTHF